MGLKGLNVSVKLCSFIQGNCAENTASKLEINREEQDEFAISSYKKTASAWQVRSHDKSLLLIITIYNEIHFYIPLKLLKYSKALLYNKNSMLQYNKYIVSYKIKLSIEKIISQKKLSFIHLILKR